VSRPDAAVFVTKPHRRAHAWIVAAGLATGGCEIAGDGGTASAESGGSSDTGVTIECPQWAEVAQTGTLGCPALTDASGLVFGRVSPVLWSHNDSGGQPRLFAVGPDGTHLGILELDGAGAIDYEDIASAPWNGVPTLWVGDLGDPQHTRASGSIYRVPEPAVEIAEAPVTLTAPDWELLDVSYVDGPHDAQAFLVDPIDEELIVITREPEGPSLVYRTSALSEDSVTLTLAAQVASPEPITAADISETGDLIVLRTPTQALVWPRPPGVPVAQLLSQPGCAAPTGAEPQGESIAISLDGNGYATVSEGEAAPMFLTTAAR
jgi:hypothetical protein